MNRSLLCCCWAALVFSTTVAPAQPYYFPVRNFSADSSLEKSLLQLSGKLLESYSPSGRPADFENLYRLQMLGGDYLPALKNLDSLRNSLVLSKLKDAATAPAVGFAYEVFAATKEKQKTDPRPFSDIYSRTLKSAYYKLSAGAIAELPDYFKPSALVSEQEWNRKCNQLKTAQKDSISLQEALSLCKAYLDQLVNRYGFVLGSSLVAQLDDRQFIIEDSTLIRTRDGSAIAATVIRKKNAPAPLPAILVFNIYNSIRDKIMAKEAALNGFVGVVANTRGKRLSPQPVEPFEHDASDAYDIIEWISRQSWNNGKVGMYGGSYLGFSQWAAAKTLHPALKTIVPQVAVGPGVDYPMTNNVFMNYMLQWIHYVTNSKQTDEADFNNQGHWDSVYLKYYTSGRSFRSLDSIEGRPSAIFQRWLRHPSHDRFWQNMVPYQRDFSKVNIPILTTTGYYDADQLGALYYFKQHHRYNRNARHYLVIGPYNHPGAQGYPASILQGYKIDTVANINISQLVFQWFNYILKDSSQPEFLKDRVNYQVMGTNEWKHAPSLDKMNTDTLTFYLSNVRSAQHYKWAAAKTVHPEFIRQEVDLGYRADTTLTGSGNLMDSSLDVSNGLSFITEAFDRPVEINGSFLGNLKASINKKDMDLALTLYELLPNGKYFQLSWTVLRASYARNASVRELLVPGKISAIPVNTSFFVSRKINPGSRLVMVLAINKTRDWQINYGSGKEVSDETIRDAGVPLQIKWYTDSWIRIPVHH